MYSAVVYVCSVHVKCICTLYSVHVQCMCTVNTEHYKVHKLKCVKKTYMYIINKYIFLFRNGLGSQVI